MARKSKTYTELIKMAKIYGVDKNALFLQAAEQFSVQQRVIQKLISRTLWDSLFLPRPGGMYTAIYPAYLRLNGLTADGLDLTQNTGPLCLFMTITARGSRS